MKNKVLIGPIYTNSIYKVNQGADEGEVGGCFPQTAPGDRRSKDRIRSKWNWYYLVVVLGYGGIGCGVKGNPEPPEKPPFIGHGDVGLPKKLKPIKKVNKYDYNKDVEDEDESE